MFGVSAEKQTCLNMQEFPRGKAEMIYNRHGVCVCLHVCAQKYWQWRDTEMIPHLVINGCIRSRMFPQHNSTIVFNVWFPF